MYLRESSDGLLIFQKIMPIDWRYIKYFVKQEFSIKVCSCNLMMRNEITFQRLGNILWLVAKKGEELPIRTNFLWTYSQCLVRAKIDTPKNSFRKCSPTTFLNLLQSKECISVSRATRNEELFWGEFWIINIYWYKKKIHRNKYADKEIKRVQTVLNQKRI